MNGSRLSVLWGSVRDGLWFVPGAMTALAATLAWAAVEADKLLLGRGQSAVYLAFGGGVEGARGVLSAIAATTITVTGVLFSVTIVALQLASSQFTPRVLRNFTGDRANQVVLGVFISTFTYTLLVLRTVRSASDDGAAFVPSLAVGIAILLALVSVGFLIFFIHHAARSIQASVVIDRAASDTLRLVDDLFPDPIGEAADPIEAPPPPGLAGSVEAVDAGYLQAVDRDALFALACGGDLVVRMEPRIGEFVLPGSSLVALWPAAAARDRGVRDRVRAAFVTGPERTLDQDLELGLQQVSEVAVRALSPSVNDPVTALMCVDRLAEVLVRLGNRAQPSPQHVDDQKQLRFITRGTDFGRAVAVAFDAILEYGRDHRGVLERMEVVLERVAALVPPHRRGPLDARLGGLKATGVTPAGAPVRHT